MTKRVYKTAKALSGGNRIYRKWAEWEVGDILVAKYESTHLDAYQKSAWVVEPLEIFFKNKKDQAAMEGKTVVLNSNGMLDKAMKQVEPGQIVQIEYQGMSTIEKGKYAGKDSHTVSVELMVEDDGLTSDDEETDDDL